MGRRIVIFTAGYHARATARHLIRHSADEVVAFVDNNAEARSRVLFDRPVLAPEGLRSLHFDLIAVPGRHQHAIQNQLTEKLGVPSRQIWLVRKSEVPPSPAELERRSLALSDLLSRATTELTRTGIDYWAIHSALLGLVRGDELASFSDMDFLVRGSDLNILASRLSEGFNLRQIRDGQNGELQRLIITANTADEWVEPAIIEFNRVHFESPIARWFVEGQWVSFPDRHFSDHETLKYRGIPVRTPLESTAVLDSLYGPGWGTPAETWNGRYQTSPSANPASARRAA